MDGVELRNNVGGRWAPLICAYSAFVLLAVVATLPAGLDMARIWIGSSSYHHGLFVAPAALWMIFVFGGRPEAGGGHILGLLIIALGVGGWLLGRAAGAGIVEQAGFVTILIGGVGAVFSDRALSVWAWPLAFLYFLVPAGESLVPALQDVTAQLIVAALNLVGFDVSIDGVVIDTSVGAFAIAEACAGLRLLIAALMISAIFAYTAFEGWGRRLAFLLFAALFAIFANAVRAFLLIIAAILSGKHTGVGPDHYIVGWALYLGVLVVLALVGKRFANRSAKTRTPMPAPSMRFTALIGAAGIVVASAAYANVVVDRPVDRATPTTLTLINAPGWRILPPPQNWRAGMNHADRSVAATYDTSGERVYVSLAYFTHDRRGAEITVNLPDGSDKHEWRKAGATQSVVYLFGTSEPRRFEKLSGPGNRKLLTLTAYWLDDELFFDAISLKRAQAELKLKGRNPEGGVFLFAASYNDDPAEAVQLIGRFTADIEPFSDWRARLAGN